MDELVNPIDDLAAEQAGISSRNWGRSESEGGQTHDSMDAT